MLRFWMLKLSYLRWQNGVSFQELEGVDFDLKFTYCIMYTFCLFSLYSPLPLPPLSLSLPLLLSPPSLSACLSSIHEPDCLPHYLSISRLLFTHSSVSPPVDILYIYVFYFHICILTLSSFPLPLLSTSHHSPTLALTEPFSCGSSFLLWVAWEEKSAP